MNISAQVKAVAATGVLLLPHLVFAQGGLGQIPPFDGTSQSGFVDAVRFIINGLLILAALAAAVFLVIGGVRYIFSQGEEEQATKAKNTILYAILGLVVIGLSAAIVNFIVTAIQAS